MTPPKVLEVSQEVALLPVRPGRCRNLLPIDDPKVAEVFSHQIQREITPPPHPFTIPSVTSQNAGHRFCGEQNITIFRFLYCDRSSCERPPLPVAADKFTEGVVKNVVPILEGKIWVIFGLYWVILGNFGLYWIILGTNGLYWVPKF